MNTVTSLYCVRAQVINSPDRSLSSWQYVFSSPWLQDHRDYSQEDNTWCEQLEASGVGGVDYHGDEHHC